MPGIAQSYEPNRESGHPLKVIWPAVVSFESLSLCGETGPVA